MWQTTVFIVLYFITSYFAIVVPGLEADGMMPRRPSSLLFCMTCHLCILIMSVWYFGFFVGLILAVLYFFSITRNSFSWVIGFLLYNLPHFSPKKISTSTGLNINLAALESVDRLNGFIWNCLSINVVLVVIYMIVSFFVASFATGLNTPYYSVGAAIIVVILGVIGFFAGRAVAKNEDPWPGGDL